MSSSWDRFTSFIRKVSNHRIIDESLKEYFYLGQNVNTKAVLDIITWVCIENELLRRLRRN